MSSSHQTSLKPHQTAAEDHMKRPTLLSPTAHDENCCYRHSSNKPYLEGGVQSLFADIYLTCAFLSRSRRVQSSRGNVGVRFMGGMRTQSFGVWDRGSGR